jgi:repressor LexA
VSCIGSIYAFSAEQSKLKARRTKREQTLSLELTAMPSSIAYILPKPRHTTWNPALEPLTLADEPGVEIPLLGYVTAGQPVETPEDNETVTVPRHMVRKNSYALRVRGHSMIDDQIQDGDIILVEKRETAENGESVVAMINGERVTLKRFYVEHDGIRLQPANPTMEPIYLRHEELQILGIVSGVIRCA